jgi:hypothetical protein
MADHEPMAEVGCGDPELSQELREALTLLSEHSDNDDFRTLVDDVLAGRCSLAEASGTAAFSNVVFASIAQEFAALTEEEKRGLAAQGGASGTTPASCGTLCAGCSGVCAALRSNSDQ